tara:strand:- start:1836 stop:2426 length:591 start_codon:yes stop_codon:yes gene_type:complete
LFKTTQQLEQAPIAWGICQSLRNTTKRGGAMALTETFLEDEIHPIDIVEHLAEHHEWEFDRIEENQIAMAVQGQWRTYSITLAWSGFDETLRLICSFEMEPPEEKLKDLYETLNVANDRCWTGAFTFWEDQKLMVYRYGLVLTGGQIATADQIDAMISSAVLTAEKYYPAFQLVVYDNQSPNKAMQVAIAEAYGHA